MPRMNGRLPHGTDAARRTHLARGEVLCPACQALADRMAAEGRAAVPPSDIAGDVLPELGWELDSG